MMSEFEAALAELEGFTGEFRRTDPQDLGCIGTLLARRHQIVAVLASQMEIGQVDKAQAARLSRAWEDGQQMEERLKLVAAGIRHQLQELYRAAWHVGALSADLPVSGSTFELDA